MLRSADADELDEDAVRRLSAAPLCTAPTTACFVADGLLPDRRPAHAAMYGVLVRGAFLPGGPREREAHGPHRGRADEKAEGNVGMASRARDEGRQFARYTWVRHLDDKCNNEYI